MIKQNIVCKYVSKNFRQQHITGHNLKDWLKNLRIVLELENLGYVLEAKVPISLEVDAPLEEKEAFNKWQADNRRVRLYMLASMNREQQTRHENM